MFALEAFMGAIWEELKKKGKTIKDLGGIKEEWKMVGLLHDGDYCEEVPNEKQGIQISKWAKERGFEIPENVSHAMASHNFATKVKPESLMDWSAFIGDSLTGLVVASTLVLPSKKLSDLTTGSVLKKFKSSSFAKGTRRQDIILCKDKLGFSLEEFIEICLKAMQGISTDLGL
ncbi:phosphohydrolase [Patescibacteria group bacterium]|nr:phosphohydrolase [Patescibacteria group bacterium]